LENTSAPLIKQVLDAGQWKFVLDGYRIKSMVFTNINQLPPLLAENKTCATKVDTILKKLWITYHLTVSSIVLERAITNVKETER
jgi:hypothetical protein